MTFLNIDTKSCVYRPRYDVTLQEPNHTRYNQIFGDTAHLKYLYNTDGHFCKLMRHNYTHFFFLTKGNISIRDMEKNIWEYIELYFSYNQTICLKRNYDCPSMISLVVENSRHKTLHLFPLSLCLPTAVDVFAWIPCKFRDRFVAFYG